MDRRVNIPSCCCPSPAGSAHCHSRPVAPTSDSAEATRGEFPRGSQPLLLTLGFPAPGVSSPQPPAPPGMAAALLTQTGRILVLREVNRSMTSEGYLDYFEMRPAELLSTQEALAPSYSLSNCCPKHDKTEGAMLHEHNPSKWTWDERDGRGNRSGISPYKLTFPSGTH